ncbi:MAG TPA: hypothetical protein VHZ25_14405 [Acidobacteriaceae bacterium]|jgi:hypothetical protein|nr:hypothetical protein [Acidobacteriaceae bacterium]
MRSTTVLSAALVCLLCTFALTGCETTRGNKRHAAFEFTSDVSTTPHPDLKFASIATGIPPVPGSPTAAGPDGMQPLNDGEARTSPGSEKGKPTPPRQQLVDRFIRQ